MSGGDDHLDLIRAIFDDDLPPAASLPLGGLETITELRETLDRLELLLVAHARDIAGTSWTEIGTALGISRQAAQRRHRLSTRRAGTVPVHDVDAEP